MPVQRGHQRYRDSATMADFKLPPHFRPHLLSRGGCDLFAWLLRTILGLCLGDQMLLVRDVLSRDAVY